MDLLWRVIKNNCSIGAVEIRDVLNSENHCLILSFCVVNFTTFKSFAR